LQKYLLLAQHVSGTIMPIIRSSRVLDRWLLPVVLGDLVFKLSVWCGAVGCVSGLRDAALSSRLVSKLPKQLAHLKGEARRPTTVNVCLWVRKDKGLGRKKRNCSLHMKKTCVIPSTSVIGFY
jgi:hypothetical protein